MRFTYRSILCAAVMIFWLVMPLATGSWIVQSVSQTVTDKSISEGLQNSIQIAGAAADDLFIVQHFVQDVGVTDPDIRNLVIIYQDDRILAQTNNLDDINRIVDDIKSRDSPFGVEFCGTDFPIIDIVPHEPDNPSEEELNAIDDINFSRDIVARVDGILLNGIYDYGDAPDTPYHTLLVSNGARHMIVPGFRLGTRIDSEEDGQPNTNASGDDIDWADDDDGVVFSGAIIPGDKAFIDVTSSQPGILNAWMDFNNDGDWDDKGEKIFADQSLDAGINHISFDVPAKALQGDAYSRFRFSSAKGLTSDGPAPDGEVEDYCVQIG